MPQRSVPIALPTVIVLGLLGAWAGSAVSAVPPTPTVSLPTVTVPPLPLPPPPLPVPLPPPPTVTVPPKVDPPPVPAAPTLAVSPPAPAPQTAGSPPAPARRSGAPRPAVDARRPVAKREVDNRAIPRLTAVPNVDREAAARIAGAPRVNRLNASVRGQVPEDGGFLGPIGAALGTLDEPAKAIPGALFAMALLAVFLLAVASAPLPLRSSPTGAMLVHKRGSIAAAGVAALAMAVATYFLL